MALEQPAAQEVDQVAGDQTPEEDVHRAKQHDQHRDPRRRMHHRVREFGCEVGARVGLGDDVPADVVYPVAAAQVDLVTQVPWLHAVPLADRLVALEHHERVGARANAGGHLDDRGLNLDLGMAGPRLADGGLELVEALPLDGDGLDHRHAE